MRFFQLVSRAIACAAVALAFTTADATVGAAQTQSSCPPVIASLLPKNASRCEGVFIPGEAGGMGKGSADIRFEHRCIEPNSNNPARLRFDFRYVTGELVELFMMAGTEEDERDILGAVETLGSIPGLSAESEKLAGGGIAYAEYMSNCPYKGPARMAAVGELELPNVKLIGVISTDNAKLHVELDGPISLDAARAAITEIFENLRKADFGKVQ